MSNEIIEKLLRSSCIDDVLLGIEYFVEREGQKRALDLFRIHYRNVRRRCGTRIGWFSGNGYRIFAGSTLFTVRIEKNK